LTDESEFCINFCCVVLFTLFRYNKDRDNSWKQLREPTPPKNEQTPLKILNREKPYIWYTS
jgi:hypothetical protein